MKFQPELVLLMVVIIFECWGVVFTSQIYSSKIIATLQRAPVRVISEAETTATKKKKKLESSVHKTTATEHVNLGIKMYQVLFQN